MKTASSDDEILNVGAWLMSKSFNDFTKKKFSNVKKSKFWGINHVNHKINWKIKWKTCKRFEMCSQVTCWDLVDSFLE